MSLLLTGIGEYVEDPKKNAEMKDTSADDSTAEYSVSSNAVVVNRATPLAIAHAAHYLIAHPAVRRSIGLKGRQTVLSYFTIQRQMEQYADLYAFLNNA